MGVEDHEGQDEPEQVEGAVAGPDHGERINRPNGSVACGSPYRSNLVLFSRSGASSTAVRRSGSLLEQTEDENQQGHCAGVGDGDAQQAV